MALRGLASRFARGLFALPADLVRRPTFRALTFFAFVLAVFGFAFDATRLFLERDAVFFVMSLRYHVCVTRSRVRAEPASRSVARAR